MYKVHNNPYSTRQLFFAAVSPEDCTDWSQMNIALGLAGRRNVIDSNVTGQMFKVRVRASVPLPIPMIELERATTQRPTSSSDSPRSNQVL